MAEHIIPQIEPLFGREERRAVYDYMCGGAWLTEHSKTAKLEAMIASYLDVNHCIMVPNCTLALYASMMALGIGPGDEVIVPAFTMIATAHAVGMTGAKVVFCDVDPETWCISRRSVEQVMTKHTKAIIQVDLNGRRPVWNVNIYQFCKRNGLFLIEDAAQALGSRWGIDERQSSALGTFGDIGCFSLSPHKIISTGQGGFIVTDRTDLAGRIRSFKSYGRIPATQHNY
ncbi:MAG: DegT/DnrJ/EryC1/StrS family aminotransferase, partial [Candidatus Thorarchaeota archaeon]